MSDRLTQKEIKQEDQFVSTVDRVLHFVQENFRALVAGIVGLLVLVLLVVAWFNHQANRRAASVAALAEATEAFQAPTGDLAANADGLSFETDEARRTEARTRLEAVRSDYSGTDSADIALYYLANLAVEEDDLDGAQQLWNEFLDRAEPSFLTAQARINLLSARRAAGDSAAVEEDLRSMLDSDTSNLPQDLVLYELAKTLEDLERGEEAAELYQRLVEEYPRSAYSADARRRSLALGASAIG
ncbi:MAG: tetratricopeptide repeat protein [Acidobacteriota bacterium]